MKPLVPPHDIEAESALLGAALLSQDAAHGITSELTSEDFYRPTHQKVFDAIQSLVLEGKEVDQLLVANIIGDRLLPLELASAVTVASRWPDWARIVKDDARLRKYIEVITVDLHQAYNTDDAEAHINQSMGNILSLMDKGNSSKTLSSLLDQRIEEYRKPTDYIVPVASGVKLHMGDFSIIAGRPGSGKTAYAIACADRWSQRYKTAFYTFEMSEGELVDRWVSRETKTSTEYTFDGLSDHEVEAYKKATEPLKARRLAIKECSGMSERQLAASLKAFAASGGRVAILDYLQIAYEITRAGENADLTRLSKILRQTAKSTGIAIVALSQFSRDGDQDDEKKIVYPRMKHLRGSGSLEQDAANVGLLYRYPDKDTAAGESARTELQAAFAADLRDGRDLIRLHWDKVRHGKWEKTHLLFDGSSMTFEEVLPR